MLDPTVQKVRGRVDGHWTGRERRVNSSVDRCGRPDRGQASLSSVVLVAVLILLLVIAVVGLAVLAVRYRRLDRDVERILSRLEVASTSKVASRALYRGVRGLERRLEDAEQATNRLRVAAERADVGVVIANAEGEIVYANPAAQRVISGRLGDAVAGTRIMALLERVQATGAEEDLELDLYTPVRSIVRLRAVPFAEGDRVGGAVGYIMDLSSSAGSRRCAATSLRTPAMR